MLYSRTALHFSLLAGVGLVGPGRSVAAPPESSAAERIVVKDSLHFAVSSEGRTRPFTPWGFNYDRTAIDGHDVLLEDVLGRQPAKLDEDFSAMWRLGGNTVRVFIATSLILKDATHVSDEGVREVRLLLDAAHRQGIRVILVGLANLRPDAAPGWFQQADDDAMAAAEGLFWKTIAHACRDTPALFAYDLQNEPAIHWTDARSWTDGCFNMSDGQKFCYVHRHERQIEEHWTRHVHEHFATPATLREHWRDYPRAGETWDRIAVPAFDGKDVRFSEYLCFQQKLFHDWAAGLRAAIRAEDAQHLITLGALDPLPLVDILDFYCLHLYPASADSAEIYREKNRKEWLRQIERLPRDKPLVIEEMYPLGGAPGLSTDDYLSFFLEVTRPRAAGWVSFYWGEPRTLPAANSIGNAVYEQWLQVWSNHALEAGRPANGK